MDESLTASFSSNLRAEQTAEGANETWDAAQLNSRTTSSPARAVHGKTPHREILIVEDDVSLAEFLAVELIGLNFGVSQVHDGEEALKALQGKRRYDLLILDLNLPTLDGISILKQIRPMQPRLPVFVLTARTGVEHRVQALNSGADDCLAKPFSLIEFNARVHALLRRNSGPVPSFSTVGDLSIYRDQRRVERAGERVELTPREYALLDVMMQNACRPVSRAMLLEEVWSTSSESSTNIVDVYMKYLRDKIDLPGRERLIHTIRGFGYELRIA